MFEYQQQESNYHGGFSLLDMLVSLAIIALILSATMTNSGGIIGTARQVADNANARQAFTYLCSELIRDTSDVRQQLDTIGRSKTVQVNYSGPADACNSAVGTSASDKLKREIVKNVPGLKGKGFRIYLTRDSGGQYQIQKVAVFSKNPAKAVSSEAAKATGSYPVGA